VQLTSVQSAAGPATPSSARGTDVLLFGATGMIGRGVLRECLLDPLVRRVLAVVRTATGQHHPKLQEILLPDFFAIDSLQQQLRGFDTCLYCLGVSAGGMSEQQYTRITYDLTLKIADLLVRLDPDMTFIYISGAGTDSSGKGRFMWARVKGRTENALRGLPFRATYMFRPGLVQPLHGVRSRTASYRMLYAVTTPILPLLRRLFPGAITTADQLGWAMLAVAHRGYGKPILENSDINAIAGAEP
jgi:uncharacterized protein YbjT (DUF2867 family)